MNYALSTYIVLCMRVSTHACVRGGGLVFTIHMCNIHVPKCTLRIPFCLFPWFSPCLSTDLVSAYNFVYYTYCAVTELTLLLV